MKLFSLSLFTFCLVSFSAPAEELTTVGNLEQVIAFAESIQDEEGRRTVGGEAVKLRLRDQRIQKQVFGKLLRASWWFRFLYFKKAAYSPTTRELGFDGIILGATETDLPHIVAPFAVRVDETLAKVAVRAADELSLDVELNGKIRQIVVGPGDRPWHRLEFSTLSVRLVAEGKVLFDGAGRTADVRTIGGPDASARTGMTPVRETLVLDLEAENASGLRFFADWELDERGWYAREIVYGRYGKGIAVVHAKNRSAVMVHRLRTVLPPGKYRVALMPFKNSTRIRNNVVEVQLGNRRESVAWFYAASIVEVGDGTWGTTPSFTTTRPADDLRIKIIQSGGGGINTVPEMPEEVVMLDRIRIYQVLPERGEGPGEDDFAAAEEEK